jgi:hypothetical protein
MAVGFVLLASLFIASRDQLLEQWWVWKLRIRKVGDYNYVFMPASGAVGERVNAMSGEIEISEYLQFLADYTGLQVKLCAPSLEFFQSTLSMAGPVENVTGDMTIAILKGNGFRVDREVLPSGGVILLVDVSKVDLGDYRAGPKRGHLSRCNNRWRL